jgi:hypothetical protein
LLSYTVGPGGTGLLSLPELVKYRGYAGLPPVETRLRFFESDLG